MPGTLDMLVLRALRRGAMHGYAIAEFIQQASDDELRVEEGALYPALHRLQLRGALHAEWGTSENNRRAKFYRLTPLGRRELEREAAEWDRIAAAVARVMQAIEQFLCGQDFSKRGTACQRRYAGAAWNVILTTNSRFTSPCGNNA